MMNALSTYLTPGRGRASALLAALTAFIIYFFSADSGVSYWDCPEYVLTASTLQVGHPPGNPIWTLAMRVATIPFPAAHHARAINMCSGLLMALAVLFLARITYRFILYALEGYSRSHGAVKISRRAAGRCGVIASFFIPLCFAVLDSTWYSAVEAEVYAFSTFLSTFTIWLMLRWAEAPAPSARSRYLILTAYVLGLSLGVHQLNLLSLPVLALIFVFRRNRHHTSTLKAWLAILLSFAAVGLILLGMMPGAIDWAASLELLCVNHFGAPYFSGVILYPILFISVALLTVSLLSKWKASEAGKTNALLSILLFSALFWLSGLFLFRSRFLLAFILSAALAAILVILLSRRAVLTSAWMLIMLWGGYSAVALILIRGYAAPPVNESAPVDIFSFQRYIAREQYGSKPLFYGATPFSRPMTEERFLPDSHVPDYSRYAIVKEQPRYIPTVSSPKLTYRSRALSAADSSENLRIADAGHGYLLSDYRFRRITTPELDIFFPRITSGNPSVLSSYEDWAGMNRENMERVEISTAIDSLGHPVGKLNAAGEREKETSLRPTYLQNLRYFLSYQVSYMYLRYLLWNFVGRQNDIPSTGEIDHGNVITGIEPIDRLMVGSRELMPSPASSQNPGRHVYFAIPFLIGILGITFLFRCGSEGRRVQAVVAMLFLMTGIAIVVYLNQDPGEPRERDYAFIVSYMAFCIWIAFGLIALSFYAVRLVGLISSIRRGDAPKPSSGMTKPILYTLSAAGAVLFGWFLIENLPDHNRNGRYHTRAFAMNILDGKERDIIFSYGDNFTFPLWYAMEVEKAAPHATLIDASYLSTPEYVINLMKQGDRAVRFTATPADIAFGAYAYTRIAKDADTVPLPLIDILRTLYADSTPQPTLRSSRAQIAGLTQADTLTIDLRKLATLSGMIPFRTLMLLDIIATNEELPSPRPLSFLSSVKSDLTLPIKEAIRPEAFSDTYAPDMTEREYASRLMKSLRAIDSTAQVHAGHTPYIDPVIDDQIRRQRGGAARVINRLSGSKEAREVLLRFPELFQATPPGSYTVADSTFHESLSAATMLLNEGDSLAAEKALQLLKRSQAEAAAWKRYYFSLPAWRRHTVSASSRRLIVTLPTIDSLILKAESIISPPKELP